MQYGILKERRILKKSTILKKDWTKSRVSLLNPEGVYLAIMSDSNAFLEFVVEINDARGDYGRVFK